MIALLLAQLLLGSGDAHARAKLLADGTTSEGGTMRRRTMPALLIEVEKKYAAAKQFSAEFTQAKELFALKQTKNSSGKIYIRFPNLLRWETLKPDPTTLVGDGKKYWVYTPPFDPSENGQVIVQDALEVQSDVATALLSGSFSKLKGLQIHELKNSEFKIMPRPGTAGDVNEATLTVDRKSRTIRKVVLKHRGGNVTKLELSEIKLADAIPDAQFKFVPPPKTDVIHAKDLKQ
jgi:outer membrane lipoprotein carrier protein